MNSNGIIYLRERLVKNLKRLIGNPVIEAKELAAFDLIMSRRQFLKTAQFTAIGALVASAYPPTAWGRYDKKLHVHPKDVGLTTGDMASVTQATQLITGTELFQDTIYAQPVVAPEAIGSHAVIEGPRGRLRLQSDLLSTDPEELQFLDAGYHYGPTELIQLEKDPTDGWELVHYHHPWGARTDGARTDGLIREVIMTESDGLINPTKVIAIGGFFNNVHKADTASQLTYAVFVEDTATGYPGHLAVGIGVIDLQPPYDVEPAYPLVWGSRLLNTNLIGGAKGYKFADKFTNGAYQNPTTFEQERATEHIVLYAENVIKIITISWPTEKGIATLMTSTLGYPEGAPEARVIHIDWNPNVFTYYTNNNSDGDFLYQNIVLASSQKQNDGSWIYTFNSINSENNVTGAASLPTIPPGTLNFINDWNSNSYQEVSLQISAESLQDGDLGIDYSMLRDVHSLYYFTPSSQDGYYHVKLANISGRGLLAIVLRGSAAPNAASNYLLSGHFPFAFPDAAGLGAILSFSGGVSKFGGFRFVASDADGNTFLLRQRRLPASDSPYPDPIYAQFNEDGTPRTSFSSNQEALPSTTASGSNLYDLEAWVTASSFSLAVNYSYNALLSLALAFATDDTSSSQAVWLGNAYKAAYAVSRFSLDTGFVAIKLAQGSTDTYAAYQVFQNQVDKTWRQRQIATQILPQGPGLQESGDHYQATVTPANIYGKPVSLLATGNENLLIEVRADSPCTVIDDTNNLYYDVDRYTSFMSPPDPATARLGLLVKADVFSQVLYVRLVDGSGLQPSSDAAMLNSTSQNVYPWQSVNVALQAQQRMGNGAPSSSLLGDNMPLVDTAVYISSDTLAQSNQDSAWQTKGDYTPTQDNLGSLATYFNTSGQNIIATSGQLSLGASVDGVTIDPLYAVTAVPSDSSRTVLTTQFAYDTGSINTTSSTSSLMPGGQLGSLWSSISHALHDALHWLQHVESDVYKDLASGGVAIVSDVESITAKVGKDIMKQVNGVEQELDEVVSTVEEYASVVVNVVVTIVENSFIYKFIEAIIALISLFLHFKDILALSDSFKGLLDDILSGSNGESIPSIPSSFSSWDTADTYLGADNTIESAFGGVDSNNVGSELIQGLLDAITGNPLTKKILNKVTSAVSSTLGEVIPAPPLSFDTDLSAAQDIMTDITDLEDNLVEAVATMTEQTATILIQQLAADAANPQQTFNNLASGLGSLSEEIAADVLTPVFDLVDTVTTNAPAYAKDMIDHDPYITLNIAVLADLCKLFGIGGVSGTKLNLKASDAVFFPLALIAWIAVYIHDGRSISSVDELDDDFLTDSGEVGASGATLWNLVRLAADGVLTELFGFSWLVKALMGNTSSPSKAEQVFAALGVWFNWIRWMNDFVYTCRNWNPATGQPWDYANVAIRLTTASADVAFTLPDKGLNSGTGWPTSPRPSDMSQVVNTLVTLVSMGFDTYLVAESNPNTNQIVAIAGQDFARSQGIATFLYNLFSLKDFLEYFAAYVLVSPFGFEMQVLALGGVLASPGEPGTRPGRHRRRRPQPRRHFPKYRQRRVGRHR